MLGVPTAIGRAITPDDDRTPGAHPYVVLSHGYWMRRFASDPAVLGQSVDINGHPMTVIGVAAPAFQGLEVGRTVDIFVPITMKAQMTPTWDEPGQVAQPLAQHRGAAGARRVAPLAGGCRHQRRLQAALAEDVKTLQDWSEKKAASWPSTWT